MNVFSYDDETKKLYTLRLSNTRFDTVINLFYYNDHYSVVKNLSRLVSSQKNKKGQEIYLYALFKPFRIGTCAKKSCRMVFETRSPTSRVYPNKSNKYMSFEKYQKLYRVPFTVYADFECFIRPVDNKIGNGNLQYQKHEPSKFCYTIKCMDETVYKDKTVLYTAKEGEDIGKKFAECLEDDLKEVYEILKTVVPIKMSEEEENSFDAATDCYACGMELKMTA